jgi:tol-pal system protein YbgF
MWAIRTALALVLLTAVTSVWAVSKSELEDRIQQLERRLDSRSLIDLMEQIKALQRDVQQLRGDIEVQTHNLEGMQKRQRDLYLDIDRRLHRLEAGGSGMQPATGFGTPGAESAGGPALPATTGAASAPSLPAPGTAPTPAPPGPGAPGAAGRAAAGVSPGAGMAAPASAPATLNPAEERKHYDQALEVLKQGRYAEAATAFRDFLDKYPNSSYADNAQYWRGEVFYVTRDFDSALAEFEKVVTQYPDSAKVPDAKLKMGYIRYELEDWDKARELLTQVAQGYPGTTSARLAQERLERMNSERR